MASKSNGVESEWVRGQQSSGSVWERIGKAIYNPEEKSFLGRTAKRWGIVFLFYLVFYAALALMFALCMGGLFLTLDPTRPTHILERSLIGASPGVAFRPLPSFGAQVQYSISNFTDNHTYIEQLEEFFRSYETDHWYLSKTGCNAEDNFGFPDAPCFFIKINKIYGWQPEYYDVSNLPTDMPQDLVDHITALAPDEAKQVWISCTEENSNATKMEYPWGRGLPGDFYPYLNEQGYRSPMLAVKLTPPVNDLTIIRCRAWAKNIIYNKSIKEMSGYTRILLYIDDQANNNTEILT